MKQEKQNTSVCVHCGLPVASEPLDKSGKKSGNKRDLFCCFGCRMVWEMDQHAPGDDEAPNRLSPLNLLYLRFALALIASMFLIFISLTLHFEAEQAPAFLRYVSLALATGVMLLLAGPFLDNLRREIYDRRLSLASLIFFGSGAAYLLSAWNTISAGYPGVAAPTAAEAGSTYFETSAMILTFYIGSLLIDTRIKRGMAAYTRLWQSESSPDVLKVVERASEDLRFSVLSQFSASTEIKPNEDAISQEMKEVDREKNRYDTAGSASWRTIRTSVESLLAGDRYLAEAGQPILTDSVVADGAGFVDEAHLTGEPDPVRKNPADVVTAGSVSIDGGLVLKVMQPYSESSLQEYLRRARAMRSRPGYYERVAARGASILLIFVMTAAFSGLFYHAYTADLPHALKVFLAVLLIGCPCAFSISTPAALWVANQRLHRSGIIAMGGSRALEKLSQTRVILFDKTGTLTEGVAFRSIYRVTDEPDWPVDRLMRLAGGLEMDQTHPFAKALRRYLDQNGLDPIWPDESRLLPGQGMVGRFRTDSQSSERQSLDAHQVLLVNGSHPDAKGRLNDSELGLFLNGRLMLRLRIYQPPRHHLGKVIQRLQVENKVKVAVVTGDPADAAAALDTELRDPEIDYHQGCSPERKAELVDEYRSRYGNVMFVGDGTNDLMAINKADLGVGVYTGTISIRNHADFVLFHPNLTVIPEMLDFARKITGTIRINFFWAVAYNIAGIAVALMGLLHPFFAIVAMMLSSLFVTFHSATLQRRQPSLGELEKQVNAISDEPLLRPGISEA